MHMRALSHVAKWGNSLAIRIPKPVAEQWGVTDGSEIEMVLQGGVLVMRKKVYDLPGMVSRMSPKTRHAEVDAGPAQGKEEW